MRNFINNFRLSYWIAFLTICQMIWMNLCFNKIVISTIPFDVLHEDTILIMHLMTFFIVKAIEDK